MAIFQNDLDYTKLIQFTNGSLQLASFVQIRNALIQRMKDIYGNDIDVSPATADGQYINSIALLINNIFQTIKQGYDSLDPASATGQYLDTLCSFNNITRITESSSIAQLYLYNSTASPISITQLSFVDKNNTLWFYDNGGIEEIIEPGEYHLITDVICDEKGAIVAPGANNFYKKVDGEWISVGDHPEQATWDDPSLYLDFQENGTIYQCVESNGLWVWQYSDADVGNIEETDEALRSRRYQMLGNNSVTILEGIKGNLLNVDGVKDVHIFNSMVSSNTAVTLTEENGFEPIADNTTLKSHSIYIAIRYKEGVTMSPEAVGRIIYNKLTPGISTSPIQIGTTENGKQGMLEIIRTVNFSDFIYWKICSSIGPKIVINFYTNPKLYNYPLNGTSIKTASHEAESDTELAIVKNLQEYLFNFPINEYLTISNLLTILQQSDTPKQGMNTFFATDGYIQSIGNYKFASNLAYFKYDNKQYKFEYNTTNNQATLTIEESPLREIILNTNDLTLAENETFELKYTLIPSTSTTSITFTSSDSTKVSIDSETMLIKAEQIGEATITATATLEDSTIITATCHVIVISEE